MDMVQAYDVATPLGPPAMADADLALATVFALANAAGAPSVLAGQDFRRCRPDAAADWDILVDRFSDAQVDCAFLRLRPSQARQASFWLAGAHRIEDAPAGGWLVLPAGEECDAYWIPSVPRARRLDNDGHILEERVAALSGLDASPDRLLATFEVPAGFCLDLVAWRFGAATAELGSDLRQLSMLETQPLFMWSSHTRFSRPADLYAHLVFGHVYENHTVWPRYWKVCSELDAYALYVALGGLALATGKRLYTLLRRQVVYSVITRQAEDGGWYHGEWTDGMESHYRLVNAAVLMLAAHVEEREDGVARESLEKAAAFLAARAHKLDGGTWFLHDSLEGSVEGMRKYPFAWSTSTALGKATINMLILNTHLDTTIALDRYAETTGDRQYQGLIESARRSTSIVLKLQPAEWLYRIIFRILDLTLLPKEEAKKLPLHTRITKRIGWKYLAPSLHRLKAAFPRLVMPNGFIDRSLCQKGFSTRYQSVHIWDLVRYQRRFQDSGIGPLVKRAVEYTYHGSIRAHWKESAERQDALGFWVEALYNLCLIDPDPKLRHWLAEAVIDAEDVGLGLPPSVLGANGEALKPDEQSPCPSLADGGLRVINLSRGENAEFLVVNPMNQPLQLEWQIAPQQELAWTNRDGLLSSNNNKLPVVVRRGWMVGTRPVQ